MALAEDLMMAGLGLTLVALALFVWAAVKTAKQRAEWYHQLPEEYPGSMVDVSMLVLWGGLLLSQISNILYHAEPGGIYRVVPLTWVAFAAVVFNFGLLIGRLMMRLEVRAHKAKREEKAREART